MCSSIPSRDAHSRQASGVLFAAVAGGFGTETVARIRVDAGGRIYVAGSTDSLDFPSSPVPDGDLVDAFAIAFDPGIGSTNPVYSRRIGGLSRTTAGDMAVDCSGNVVLAATSNTPDLRAATDALPSSGAGGYDVLLALFSPGGALTSLSYFGGEKDEDAFTWQDSPPHPLYPACSSAQPNRCFSPASLAPLSPLASDGVGQPILAVGMGLWPMTVQITPSVSAGTGCGRNRPLAALGVIWQPQGTG